MRKQSLISLDFDDPWVQREWLLRVFVPYSNPWWSDPRDLVNDQMARDAAQRLFEGQCVRDFRRKRRRRQALSICVLLVGLYVYLVRWLGGSSDPESDLTTMFALGGLPFLLLVLYVLFACYRRSWAEKAPYTQFYILKRELEERSRNDYRVWLDELRLSNPDLFFQINVWSQNERAIEIQTRTMIAAQRAASAAERAAVAAQQNEQNTRAIRNQIRNGHE